MLSQEVLDELNASGGVTGSMPGSLIAVPTNQSAPSGYDLYQRGEPKELVREEKASISVARRVGGSVVTLNGKIYLAGGYYVESGTPIHQKLLEMYDPTSNTWTSLSPMSTNRGSTATTVMNGKIYVIGGEDGSGLLDTVEIYDPSTGNWSFGRAAL